MLKNYEVLPRKGGSPRNVALVTRVDESLALFLKQEALREFTSVSSVLASLAAELRRQRRREGWHEETIEHDDPD